MVATALGVVFLGYAFTIAIGSPLLDFIGMGRLLVCSASCFLVGTTVVVFSQKLQGALSLYQVVWLGMLIIGIGQGLVETVINPLAATLYPDDKDAPPERAPRLVAGRDYHRRPAGAGSW